MPNGTKLTVEERLDIQELFARYCWSLNTGDADGYLDCFAEDGWIEHFPPKRHGRSEIRGMLQQVWYGRPHAFLGRQHHPHNFLLIREGDDVRARVQWSVTRLDQPTNRFHIFLLGDWNAVCAREGESWKFRSLQIGHWFRQSAPWMDDPVARLVLPGDEHKGPAEF
jgi:hypothetical protein